MKLSTWSLGVISTGYDMKDLRATLIPFLSSALNFRVLAYEDPEFPVEPGVHSHEACVKAFHEADIVILIIDKRYGELYLGHGETSVTVEEYRASVKRKKIIIPCVRSEAWQEFQSYISAMSMLDAERVDKERLDTSTSYVDNHDVLNFIREVSTADKDNFIIIFNTAHDLQQKLQGRLSGLSRYLLMKIVEKQCQIVRDIKTTTGMAFSLGDVLSKGFFLEPPFLVRSGDVDKGEMITNLVAKVQMNDCCIAILGQPGSGKSTILGKAFLDHTDSLEAGSKRLPFYVSLRARGVDFTFSFEDYVKDSFEKIFGKELYPQMNFNQVSPVFYIDGFDELAEDVGKLDLSKFYESYMFQRPFILSSRSRFASENLDTYTLGSRLSLIIELQQWDEDMTKRYIGEFCKILKREELAKEIEILFQSQEGIAEIYTNPLLLTLFLWVVQESEMSIPIDVSSKRTLFEKFLIIWANRELARLGMNGTIDGKRTVSRIVKAWELGAWEVYKSRFKGAKNITMSEMLNNIESLRPESKEICTQEVFLGLFEIRPFTDEVTGMLHEQLLEYLIARAIVNGMDENAYPFPMSLTYTNRYEVNQIIRSIWEQKPTDKLRITLKHLWQAYIDVLPSNDFDSIIQRNQSMYYLGRIRLDESVDYLRKADEIENSLFVKLAIGFSLIKLLQFDVEEVLYTKLKEEKDYEIENRGYHLVYYKDWQLNHSPPFKDPGDIQWDNTMNAIIRHIESSSARHVALRRVEILTMRHFIVSRGERGPLDREKLLRIEKAINCEKLYNENNIPKSFFHDVLSAYDDLKKCWVNMDD